MENLKLNETPVRTAKNFRINNIKLENIEIPEVIPKFENITITGDTSKIDIEQNADNIDINLAYGLSEELAVQVKAQANQKLKLNLNGCKNEETEIDFKFDDENSVLVDDIEITATENTKSTVVIKYTSNQESENYHNGIIKAKAEKDSELNIVLINLMNTKSNNFLAIENDFEENAKINYIIIDFGGKNSITNYYSNLLGVWSIKVNGVDISSGGEKQTFDMSEDNLTYLDSVTVKTGKFAPGTQACFEVVIDPTNTDVSILYTLDIKLSSIKEAKLTLVKVENYFQKDGETDKITNEDVNTGVESHTAIIPIGKINESYKNHIKMYFEWINLEENNENDSIIGSTEDGGKITIPLEINLKQYTGEGITNETI